MVTKSNNFANYMFAHIILHLLHSDQVPGAPAMLVMPTQHSEMAITQHTVEVTHINHMYSMHAKS
jgi:hypothetical protein